MCALIEVPCPQMALRDLRRLWSERRSSRAADPEIPRPSLPLLQVWPSQDSPRSEGTSFTFQDAENLPHSDSGIDSIQVSPCVNGPGGRSPSAPCRSALLHPDQARPLRRQSADQSYGDQEPISGSSSTASSLSSVRQIDWERRRSSTMTARYSLLDALDLEYALFRAAARGSVGPYSLSESIHKLTFTQSLAFPALARGLAGKRRRSSYLRSAPIDPRESGLNAFAKIITALVLMLVSVMVFGVVYKFVRT